MPSLVINKGSAAVDPLDWTARPMNQSEFRTYHEREALRLRRLMANASTLTLKARLAEEAEKHDRLAQGLDDLTGPGAYRPSQS